MQYGWVARCPRLVHPVQGEVAAVRRPHALAVVAQLGDGRAEVDREDRRLGEGKKEQAV